MKRDEWFYGGAKIRCERLDGREFLRDPVAE
jgi:hypothetical protein